MHEHPIITVDHFSLQLLNKARGISSAQVWNLKIHENVRTDGR